MPRKAKELTALQVRRLTGKPGLHPVGGISGLGLKVTPPSAASWILRTMVQGRRRDIGLGPYPEISLEAAREAARETKAGIRGGNDPVRQRQVEKQEREAAAHTFKFCAEQFIAKKSAELRSETSKRDLLATMQTYVYPLIGTLPVASITVQDILNVLRPIWTKKTTTAKRVQHRIESVLAFAQVQGWRDGENVARWRGNLDVVLPKPSKIHKGKHHDSVPYAELAVFMQQLRDTEGTIARMLEFLVLTATRSNEVRGAVWSEIDLEAKTWTIPAARMKAGKDHVIPLPEQAVCLLQLLDKGDGDALVFPGQHGRMIGKNAMQRLVSRLGRTETVHGFRATFSTWAQETTQHSIEAVELSLAHVATDATRAAYARGMLLEKRRELLTDWADHIDGADVLAFECSA